MCHSIDGENGIILQNTIWWEGCSVRQNEFMSIIFFQFNINHTLTFSVSEFPHCEQCSQWIVDSRGGTNHIYVFCTIVWFQKYSNRNNIQFLVPLDSLILDHRWLVKLNSNWWHEWKFKPKWCKNDVTDKEMSWLPPNYYNYYTIIFLPNLMNTRNWQHTASLESMDQLNKCLDFLIKYIHVQINTW